VTVFSGEELILDRPLTRAAFEDLTPAVLIESPLAGDQVSSPLLVTGSANVLEAVFRLRLLDQSGRIVAQTSVHATAGTGTRGTFRVTLRPTRAVRGPALLEAMTQSPRDGSWRVAGRCQVDVLP
jgi:hypothetical protein